MRSKHDVENLTVSSYSVPLKTSNTKLEIIPPKDAERDTVQVKTTFPKGLNKVLNSNGPKPVCQRRVK